MSEHPTRCQIPGGGCEMPPAFLLVFESAAISGRGAGPGMRWIEATCRSHADQRKDQVRREGGRLVAVDDLPAPIGIEAGLPGQDRPS